jgi:putative membrane protein
MSERAFLDPKMRELAGQTVTEVERQTSAEVVIAVRPASGHYRHADYLFGFGLALAGLVALLFVDVEYDEWMVAVMVPTLFVAGAVAAAHLGFLRRALTGRKLRRAQVDRAAKVAFVDLGISKTHHRAGILVYASLFEREVAVVPDVAVTSQALGSDWDTARAALEGVLRPTPNAARLLEAVRALGPPLARVLPHVEGQANELPDEPQAA